MQRAVGHVFGGRKLMALLATGFLLGTPVAARADNIDQALLTEGPTVMQFIKKNGYKSVGVLPFRVAKGTHQPSFNVGAMNNNMASRLENTLILLDDSKSPISILHDAGSVAARSRSASYTNVAGRKNLLNEDYPLAWGNSRAKADAFLTGDVNLSSDNKKVTVVIKAFDKKAAEPRVVHQFSVKTDRSILADCAQSFQLSRNLRRGDDPEEAAATDATKKDTNANPQDNKPGQPNQPTQPNQPNQPQQPSAAAGSEVKMTILYDGKPADSQEDPVNQGERRVRLVKPRGAPTAATTVASAKEGQKVAFVLENTSPTETYAVVLKVNGQNTLFQEMDDAVNCTKWVLPPGKDGKPTRYTINGFWLKEDGSELLPFRVLSEDESMAKAAEFQNPQQIGLIDFHILKAGPGTSGDPTSMAIARKVNFRGLTQRDQAKARTLDELKASLLQKSNTKHENGRLVADIQRIKNPPKKGDPRGLITGDAATKTAERLERVSFDNAEEVSHQSIRYYAVAQAEGKP